MNYTNIIWQGLITFFVVFTAVFLVLTTTGCAIERTPDGAIVGIGWKPEIKKIGDDIANTAEGSLDLLALISPAVAAGAAGVIATWRKMSKTTIKFQKPLEFYVKALERVKDKSPEAWAAIKEEIKSGKPPAEIEGTVREILDDLYQDA